MKPSIMGSRTFFVRTPWWRLLDYCQINLGEIASAKITFDSVNVLSSWPAWQNENVVPK